MRQIRIASREARWATGVLALALFVTGCGTEGDGGNGMPGPTATVSTSGPPVARQAAVYFVTDTRSGFRLAREWRDLTGSDLPKAAVEAMIAGPADPDYATTWDKATRVLSVTREAGVIVVDLSRESRTANAGSEVAARMVQQLVYTVTEAIDRSASVRLLIEGEPAGELWGVLEWSEPVRRERPVDVRMLVQIESPGEGATVQSPVEVVGDAAAFEANVPWRVLDESGAVVKEGAAMTSAGQRFAPYSFSVDLAPGDYVVVVSEGDPSGGEGGTPMMDTKSVTVQ
jgi:hypothetical protein